MPALRRTRGRLAPFLLLCLLVGLGGCQLDAADRDGVSPVEPAAGLQVSSSLGPIDVLGHGSDDEGQWIRFRRGNAMREINFGRQRLAGGAVRAFLSLRDGGQEQARLEVDPGPDSEQFVPRVWIVAGGRRTEVDLDPMPGLALPPRLRLPPPADLLVREAAAVLSSSRVQQELCGGRLERPSSLGGSDCSRAWKMMIRSCVDPSNTHECTYWVVKLFSCILIALASL